MSEIDTAVRITQWAIADPKVPLYDASVTKVQIVDEGGGEFIELLQEHDEGTGSVRLNPEEALKLIELLPLVMGRLQGPC